MWLGPTGNCGSCGISDGVHLAGCPNDTRNERHWTRPGCKECGWWQSGYHYSTCPQHPKNREKPVIAWHCKKCGSTIVGEHSSSCSNRWQAKAPRGCNDKVLASRPDLEMHRRYDNCPVHPVEPDEYVSPHSVYHGGETPVVTPVFDYTEDSRGGLHAFHRGDSYAYPHREWVNARDAYATAIGDPENDAIMLQAVLDCVTETNPPPGPPIPVFKPREPSPDRARSLFFAAFAFLFMTVGLLPLLVMLFG
jgi:hypothetical protein